MLFHKKLYDEYCVGASNPNFPQEGEQGAGKCNSGKYLQCPR